ncbi:myosin-14-like isoform X2 [Cheilinus undulatus]|uniref:myosin-14-like isoform X2 n=1 Tax=Cheilinus undulatus TaxID=241271 RepID=UPI001BD6B282|nr:myosin-14-like isoform X2 [Cheilinus undulatus]
METNVSVGDAERTSLLTQIRYLEDQLDGWRPKCDELEKKNKDLISQRDARERSTRETQKTMKRPLAALEGKWDELDEELRSRRRASGKEREELKLQHGRNVQELQEQISQMRMKTSAQAAEMTELTDQVNQLRQKWSDVVCQREEHETAMTVLKKKAELQRQTRVEEIKNSTNIEHRASQILKKERAEIEKLAKDQGTLMRSMDSLKKDPEGLEVKTNSAWAEIEELKKSFVEAFKRRRSLMKQVKQLIRRSLELNVEMEPSKKELQQLMDLENDLRETLAASTEKILQREAELAQLEVEQQTRRNRTWRKDGEKLEAVFILRHILSTRERQETQRSKEDFPLIWIQESEPSGECSNLSWISSVSLKRRASVEPSDNDGV